MERRVPERSRSDVHISRPAWDATTVLCVEGSLFAAASESVALTHLGFSEESVRNVPPGHVVIVDGETVRVEKYAESPRKAHCFFEWIYFANAGSSFDDAGVYLSRKRLGKNWPSERQFRLARM